MEDHVLKHVRKFCDKLLRPVIFESGISVNHVSEDLKGPWSQAKDMSRWASYLTFDIMGDLCFSNTFNMLDSSENHYMLDVLPAGVQGLNIVSQLNGFCIARRCWCLFQMGHMQGLASLHLDKIIFRDLAVANNRYKAFSDKQAKERIENADKVTVKDVFYFLRNGRDSETGEAFTLPELVSESSLLIVAGMHHLLASSRFSIYLFIFAKSRLLITWLYLRSHTKNWIRQYELCRHRHNSFGDFINPFLSPSLPYRARKTHSRDSHRVSHIRFARIHPRRFDPSVLHLSPRLYRWKSSNVTRDWRHLTPRSSSWWHWHWRPSFPSRRWRWRTNLCHPTSWCILSAAMEVYSRTMGRQRKSRSPPGIIRC